MNEPGELTYLNLVSEFAEYLSSADHDVQSNLRHLSRVVFKPFWVNQAAFIQLSESDRMIVISRIGMRDAELSDQNNIVDLDMNYPVCEALRENRIVWINSLPSWGMDYPNLKNFKVNPEDKLYFCLPVLHNEIPIAVLSFRCRYEGELKPEIEAFLKAIASVFSLYHYRKITVSPEEKTHPVHIKDRGLSTYNQELTERQRVILRLMAEDRTNQSISEFLGYSESTIRQEIMKIFDKLGCAHRSEASAIYRNNELINL